MSRLEDKIDLISKQLDTIRTEQIPELRVDIATLKVKSGIWGGLTGTLGGVLAVILAITLKYL